MQRITGYTEAWSVVAGQRVHIHASSERGTYYASLVRHCRAISKLEDWPDSIEYVDNCHVGPIDAPERALYSGSYAYVDFSEKTLSSDFSLLLTLYPSALPDQGGSLVEFDYSSHFVRVNHDSDGRLLVVVQNKGGDQEEFLSDQTIGLKKWSQCAVCVRRRKSGIAVEVLMTSDDVVLSAFSCEVGAMGEDSSCSGIVFGGETLGNKRIGNFCGKVESPKLYGELTTIEESNRRFLRLSEPSAHWFLPDSPSTDQEIPDRCGNYPELILVNCPGRAVTSSAWQGQTIDVLEKPELYDAVYLHRDDLVDACWPTDATIELPESLSSGIYSIVISENESVDWSDRCSYDALPLFVLGQSKTNAKVALVLPTFTYRAYANTTEWKDVDKRVFKNSGVTHSKSQSDYAEKHSLKSLYDTHEDNTGVHLASLKRPQITVRPDWVSLLIGMPHLLSADLAIVQWLYDKGIKFDVLTDDELHRHGNARAKLYDVLLTGSHPEYTSPELLEAYNLYTSEGGSLIYLGGNGFYWTVAVEKDSQNLIEVRRESGLRTWSANPAELRHQLDNCRGGLWLNLGRPADSLVGLRFSSAGFSGKTGSYFVPDSLERDALTPRLKRVLGDIGNLPFGVAGLELDKFIPDGDHPSQVTVIGKTSKLPAGYVPTVEGIEGLEALLPDPLDAFEKLAVGNVVLFRYESGGLCFAVGSINWTYGLLDDQDYRFVSRITEAVLSDFLDDATQRRARELA